jgi:phage-related protein
MVVSSSSCRYPRTGITFAVKPLRFVGSSYQELCAFPRDVYRNIGRALMVAQLGEKTVNAKPLKGFVGSGVLEVIEDHRGDTYRAVYAVRFASAISTCCTASRRRARAAARFRA